MRNLFLLIKYYHKFFIFLILELFCMSIIIRNNSIHRAAYINSARGFTGYFYNKKNNITSYLDLKNVNEKLLLENSLLKNKIKLQSEKNPLHDTSYNKTIVLDDSSTQNIFYTYIPAKVLNNTIDQKYNFITLNVGSKNGIKKNMSVISANGIVGKITFVSTNYSLASSLLSEGFTVSCKTPKGTVSPASWQSNSLNPNYIVLSGVPQSEKLKKGDTIYTSGYSIFPENIMVGRAAKVTNGNRTGIVNYEILLSSNFQKLHYVYVVEDIATTERKILEDSAKIIQNEQSN